MKKKKKIIFCDDNREEKISICLKYNRNELTGSQQTSTGETDKGKMKGRIFLAVQWLDFEPTAEGTGSITGQN